MIPRALNTSRNKTAIDTPFSQTGPWVAPPAIPAAPGAEETRYGDPVEPTSWFILFIVFEGIP